MKHYRGILFWILFFIVYNGLSQEIPPLQTFTPQDYQAENQNWSITQDEDKRIYLANNKGLIDYNGDNWTVYPTPNESIMRSVLFHDGRLFSGFYKDFGYWKRNEFGFLKYTSIKKLFNIEMLEDEQIWEIFNLGDWMVFKSLQRIYLINLKLKQTKVISSKNNITKLTKIDEMFYFQDYQHGVYKIENGTPKLLSDDIRLKNNKIIQFYKKSNGLYAITQSSGIYQITEDKVTEENNLFSRNLKGLSLYSAVHLSNGDFGIGTISNGFLYFSEDGNIQYRINQTNGLTNNTVLAIHEDQDRNIWLGLDKGIGLLNLSSCFRFYDDRSGSLGTVYASVKFDGKLYLGTNQGLFYKEENSKDEYKLVPNTLGQVWSLAVFDSQLFCGHDKGTLLVKDNDAELISKVLGAWMIRAIDKNTLIQGNYDGLHILKKKKSTWQYAHKVENYRTSSKQFELINPRTLFINHEYKGVYKLQLSEDLKKVTNIRKINTLEKGLHSSLTLYNDQLLYASKKGVFAYDEKKDDFRRDSLLSNLLPEKTFESAKLVHDKSQNKLWSFTSEGLRFLTPGSLSSANLIQKVPISGGLIKGASGYENIISLDSKKYLIGTSNGYVILNLEQSNTPGQFEVSIDRIGAYEKDKPLNYVDPSADNSFETLSNNILFNCGLNSYDKTYIKKYKYKLEGYNSIWNEMKNSNQIVYENLPAGDYKLKVHAYLNDVKSVNESEFSFTIQRPWYKSDLMYLLYLIVFGLIMYAIHLITRRYYQNQREKILEKSQQEIELKQLESSKQLIKLNNEKLRSEIEGKNRELAISTMSIIKKNEFLNEIKTELTNGGEKNIKKVIRIIDKDLNNTDDWKMFQEAFNNADKKFLRKIKTRHPELTPNDLRLCAYLRLNLSSKEIAPLLNISPRSVEVKRYRLRKKMKLDHDINLTSYIIDI